jgi:hypothetical protein
MYVHSNGSVVIIQLIMILNTDDYEKMPCKLYMAFLFNINSKILPYMVNDVMLSFHRENVYYQTTKLFVSNIKGATIWMLSISHPIGKR